MHRSIVACGLAGLLLLSSAPPAPAATITIVNLDDPGEGFNDPTPVAPIGGNMGTTRGAQRLNVFKRACQIWGRILPSNVAILVRATFDPLACNPTSGVLAAAGALEVDANFPGAPFPGTWYPIALANKLAGFDRSPGSEDIESNFNSSLDGDPNCLGGVGWYYGYDGNEGAAVDLLPTVLHELAHGLGFDSLADLGNGALLAGLPDIFTRFVYDRTLSRFWYQMTDAERLASSTNTRNVVWNGPVTTGAAALVLGPPAVVIVVWPASIAGTYLAGTATFGPSIDTVQRNGQVVLVDDGVAPPSDGCSPLQNAAQIAGKIALVDRGTCGEVVKAQQAQAAGAVGVIVVDDIPGPTPPDVNGAGPEIRIPVVSITQADGDLIKAHLAEGVQAILSTDASKKAGADPQGRVLLYAPNPSAPRASISHFDVSCRPNLLMEPVANRDLGPEEVDLTRFLFQDLGWFTGATDASSTPAVTRLVGNAPNPFNPGTTIYFDLALAGEADLSVYDVAGRRVRRLAHGHLAAGPHALRWDGLDARGRGVASGVYIARLTAGEETASLRMVAVK